MKLNSKSIISFVLLTIICLNQFVINSNITSATSLARFKLKSEKKNNSSYGITKRSQNTRTANRIFNNSFYGPSNQATGLVIVLGVIIFAPLILLGAIGYLLYLFFEAVWKGIKILYNFIKKIFSKKKNNPTNKKRIRKLRIRENPDNHDESNNLNIYFEENEQNKSLLKELFIEQENLGVDKLELEDMKNKMIISMKYAFKKSIPYFLLPEKTFFEEETEINEFEDNSSSNFRKIAEEVFKNPVIIHANFFPDFKKLITLRADRIKPELESLENELKNNSEEKATKEIELNSLKQLDVISNEVGTQFLEEVFNVNEANTKLNEYYEYLLKDYYINQGKYNHYQTFELINFLAKYKNEDANLEFSNDLDRKKFNTNLKFKMSKAYFYNITGICYGYLRSSKEVFNKYNTPNFINNFKSLDFTKLVELIYDSFSRSLTNNTPIALSILNEIIDENLKMALFTQVKLISINYKMSLHNRLNNDKENKNSLLFLTMLIFKIFKIISM